jgi:hypothetical protein
MKIRKVINEPIDEEHDGVSIAGGVNAVVSANVGEKGERNKVSTRQRTRIVQRGGKTEVFEQEVEEGGTDD